MSSAIVYPPPLYDDDSGIVCVECDALIEFIEDTRETISGDHVCDSCVDVGGYYPCEDCGLVTDGPTSETDRGAIICESCASSYSSCDEAECLMIVEYASYLTTTIDGIEICRYCMDRDYHMCWDCERAVRDGDYCDDCTESDDYDHGDGDYGLEDYGYQPSPIFHGTGPLFMGLELELEMSGRTAFVDCVEIAHQRLGGLAYLKEDSSIDNGFEIVTHPMSHDYAASSFPWGMLDSLAASGAEAGYSAGLHVHVSRKAFDGPAHIYRWLKLLYRNASNVSAIARRDSHQWAPFRDSDRAFAKDYAKGSQDARRYAAVNVTNDATFEIRVFASSLTSQEVRAALDLVASSVEYTRSLTVADIVQRGGWDWNAYSNWVSVCPTYAALTAEMGALCAS